MDTNATALREFHALVADFHRAMTSGAPEPEPSDDYMLTIDGRIVQLRLAGGGTVLVSTPVYLNERGPEAVLPGPIAEFNAFHLFSGGYRLLVEETTASLYVEQSLAIRRFGGEALRTHLVDFAERAKSCTRWYLALLEEAAGAGKPNETDPNPT